MKTALGFGLVLLTVAAPCALAGAVGASSTDQSAAAFSFFLSGPGSSSARTAQGYLGVSVRDVTPDQLPALKLKDARGAEIILVDHDAPAGKAGLREHDVVLQINGQTIAGKDQLSRMLHESAPGRSITLRKRSSARHPSSAPRSPNRRPQSPITPTPPSRRLHPLRPAATASSALS